MRFAANPWISLNFAARSRSPVDNFVENCGDGTNKTPLH
jgi:hypothetical protein